MRAYVLAVALTALAQPALARDSRHGPHHFSRHHHHHRVAHVRHHRVHPLQSFGRDQASYQAQDRGGLNAMIARHAQMNGVPVELVHRVVIRESRYNPRASNRGNIGLMQIRHATARGMGYAGTASGLLDAETNLTYAVRYLAGAYRAAGGNASRAVAYYASGYRGRTIRPRLAQGAAWSSPPPSDSWHMQQEPSQHVALRDNGVMIAHRPHNRWHRHHRRHQH